LYEVLSRPVTRGQASRRESAFMHAALMAEQAASIVSRLVMLVMELTVAAAVITGAIFVGHELREWREWYWALPPAFEAPPQVPAVTEP
jgi:hypothetical protein